MSRIIYMIKFNIIKVGANYDAKIFGTYSQHRDAVEALAHHIAKNYKEEKKDLFKVYTEDKDKYSIYDIGYLGKYLNCLYFIVEYDDSDNNYIDE